MTNKTIIFLCTPSQTNECIVAQFFPIVTLFVSTNAPFELSSMEQPYAFTKSKIRTFSPTVTLFDVIA